MALPLFSSLRTLVAAGAVLAALWGLPGPAGAEPPVRGMAEARAGKRVFLPAVSNGSASPASNNSYEAIPIRSSPTGIPAEEHGDLNLALRGYSVTSTSPALVDFGGATDGDAPQMPGIFADNRTPELARSYRVNDWNWACGQHGCPGNPITSPPVTLLGMGTRPGEPLAAPRRRAEVYPGGYKTMVLYADATRITLKYTRDDNVVDGYTVHMENLNVDPNLLDLYRRSDEAGRGSLPGLRDGQPLGTAAGSQVLVAIRDNGSFMDPRSRKDWWQGR